MSKPSILIVEDDPDIVAFLSVFLGHFEGFPLRTAQNGLEALAILDTWSPSLILCDWLMPVMNGKHLLQELTRRGSTIPVCVMAATPYNAEALSLRANHFLSKPFELDDLLAMIAHQTKQEVPTA